MKFKLQRYHLSVDSTCCTKSGKLRIKDSTGKGKVQSSTLRHKQKGNQNDHSATEKIQENLKIN